jgi:hypothetical protein
MKNNGRMMCLLLLAVAVSAWVLPALQGFPVRAALPGTPQWGEFSSPPRCFLSALTMRPAEAIAVRWSTALDANAVRILTREQTIDGKLNEIDTVIRRSLTWRARVNDPSPPRDVPVTRVTTPLACRIDGVNSICFDQADMAFTLGVLTITRVVTANGASTAVSGEVESSQAGQVLDADIYFNPSNSPQAFATPSVLAQNPRAFDLQAVLLHDWQSALAFRAPASAEEMPLSCSPFAPALSGPNPSTPRQP